MALIPVNLFFNKNKKYGVNSDNGFITFDILVNESHNFSSNITSHPIENGSEVSDHIRNQLEQGSFTGLISNFSVKSRFLFSNRAQDAFDLFVELWKQKVLFTITTVMRVYKSMGITNISINRDFSTGDAVVFNVGFRKVEQVSLKTVVLETRVNVKDMSVKQNQQSAVETDVGRTQ